MSRLFDLTGHVGLITGGNSGIGLGYAKGLAECGAAVAIRGTNRAKNDAAVEELGTLGGDVHAVICDVGDRDAVVAAMAETVSGSGASTRASSTPASAGGPSSFLDMSDEEWRSACRA